MLKRLQVAQEMSGSIQSDIALEVLCMIYAVASEILVPPLVETE